MALVRVYCGLTAADMASWLTVAVVDDAGRLLDVRDVSDDPAGFAQLGSLLSDRSGAAAPVAADRSSHLVTQLLAAANRPIAVADEEAVDDYAERFSDEESIEELESPPAERRAIGLARALQAGALSATTLPAPGELDAFKPVLAAHAAVVTGRQAAAAALREVLRELYPAALRAYPDPAEPVPLAVLDRLSEPGKLTNSAANRSRDALVAELTGANLADAESVTSAVTALRVAIAESPRRTVANRALAQVVSDTVRHAVAAVRAFDSAAESLIESLVEKLGATSPPVLVARPRLSTVASSPAPEPAAARAPSPRRRGQPVSAPPAAVVPLGVPGPAVAAMTLTPPPVPAAAASSTVDTERPALAPPVITPSTTVPSAYPPELGPVSVPRRGAPEPLAESAHWSAMPVLEPEPAARVAAEPPRPAPQPAAEPARGRHLDPPDFIPAGFDQAGFEPPRFEPPKFEAPRFEMPRFDPSAYGPTPLDGPSTDSRSFESSFGQPAYDTTSSYSLEPPSYQPPSFEAPSYQPPSYDPPSFDPPSFDLPPLETPSYEPTGYGSAYDPVRVPDQPLPFDAPDTGRSRPRHGEPDHRTGEVPAASSARFETGGVDLPVFDPESFDPPSFRRPEPAGNGHAPEPRGGGHRRRGDRYDDEDLEYVASLPSPRPAPEVGPPGSRDSWPLIPKAGDDMARQPYEHGPRDAGYSNGYSTGSYSYGGDPIAAQYESPEPVSGGRTPPPWRADDMPAEPVSLRLVEPGRNGERRADPLTDPLPPDPFEGLRYEPPALRVIHGEGDNGGGRRRAPAQSDRGYDRSDRPDRPQLNGSGLSGGSADPSQPSLPGRADPAPAAARYDSGRYESPRGDGGRSDSGDGDLLIFSQTRSAWFTNLDADEGPEREEPSWGHLADEGWRAAEQAARPAVGSETTAGLPIRVPQANLVPGSAITPSRPLRVVRDPESIAAHTTGYFRGWRRGQEIGGFAVGQRDRGAWEFNREQRGRREPDGYSEQPARRL